MNNLREDAELVLLHVEDDTAAGRLAKAYLADHPADDDEPVTEEWLCSVGAKKDDVSVFFPSPIQGVPAIEFSKEQAWLTNEDYAGVEIKLKTRGDVRRLCAALGIEMKSVCQVPPKGWRCTRQAGHEGPCAALPD